MLQPKTIGEMSVRERKELLAAVADTLDQSAREARASGDERFALNSRSLALIIRGSAEDLSHHELHAAELLLEQGISMIEEFRVRAGTSAGSTSTLH
ncbi:hypothetical protein EPK99_10355 [Neorhizobium lilium]|uniref:Uncharacterized protein n=1 Tax=Neorhizobium lilium TaxID=2503024 RepID=A0A444LJ90_9HYPH|nr:hypothetical protein [Neorhizobium lilium]RWX78967.1 hypothetical protein EPK99_10355 [Neorhizobium lilium]